MAEEDGNGSSGRSGAHDEKTPTPSAGDIERAFDNIPLPELLAFLRSLPATVFQLKKAQDGKLYWLFYEGALAEKTGFHTLNMRDQRLDDVHPPGLPADLEDRVERTLKGKPQKEVYASNDRYLKLYLQRSRDLEGKMAQAVDGAVTDVTQRVRALREQRKLVKGVTDRNKRLAGAMAQAERLNYTLSHDLRNPLTVILSYCEVLERELKAGTGDPVSRVRTIRKSANRMNEMLTGILKFSRSQRMDPEIIEVDASLVAHEVMQELAGSQPDRDVEYHIQPRLKVQADPHLLRDLLENLLSNAWKYTQKKKNPRIEVAKERKDDVDWICVRDNGIGFSNEEKQEMFQPFKRWGAAVEFSGTGVGLATAKRIVERHGGRIVAQGETGEGASFCFTLSGEKVAAPEEPLDDMEAPPTPGGIGR